MGHHFYQADNKRKALEYFEKAGDNAMKTFAIGEAIEFFSKVLTLIKDSEAPRERMAHWQVLICG